MTANDSERTRQQSPIDYGTLMQRRIRRVLLISSSYDAYTLEEDGRIVRAVLQRGEETEEIPADLVINSAGIAPATSFITNVEKARNGAICVNERMETSIPDVYAAGDCSIMKSAVTGDYLYAPLGTNANKQGRIIGDILGGVQPKPFKLIGSSALRLFGIDAAKVGLSEKEAKASDSAGNRTPRSPCLRRMAHSPSPRALANRT